MNDAASFGWVAIVRLGLVQTALGSIVVLTTSTLNRIMVVELALPAVVPGALVGLHYALQVLRPRFGYGSDQSGKRGPWIIGGMAALALGGFGAAAGTAWAAINPMAGILLAVASFVLIGVGVGAAGVSILALLAMRVRPQRRPASATIVWLMMIAGFVLTTALSARFLDPYSPSRLLAVSAVVCGSAFTLAVMAISGIERPPLAGAAAPRPGIRNTASFRASLREVWAEARARRFTIFIFVSMLAYSGQDLILEPFAGKVFGMTPGESTGLSAVQNTGVFVGMVAVALAGSAFWRSRTGSMRRWTIAGCIASAVTLAGISAASILGTAWPLRGTVFLMGAANGIYAAAAIAWMMTLAGGSGETRQGIRMGVWGAGQAIAFGIGGFIGTLAVDLARAGLGSVPQAYAVVFAGEAAIFMAAAILAARIELASVERVVRQIPATVAR